MNQGRGLPLGYDEHALRVQWLRVRQEDILKALAETKLHPKVLINDETKSFNLEGRTVYYRRTFDMKALEFTMEAKREGVPEHFRFRRPFRIHLVDIFENCCSHFDLQLNK